MFTLYEEQSMEPRASSAGASTNFSVLAIALKQGGFCNQVKIEAKISYDFDGFHLVELKRQGLSISFIYK